MFEKIQGQGRPGVIGPGGDVADVNKFLSGEGYRSYIPAKKGLAAVSPYENYNSKKLCEAPFSGFQLF
ncbi:MAG: hypothetical protein R6V15_05990 [Desulfotignum sp.]